MASGRDTGGEDSSSLAGGGRGPLGVWPCSIEYMDNTRRTSSPFSLKGEGLQGKEAWLKSMIRVQDVRFPNYQLKKKEKARKKRLVILVISKRFDERNYSFYNHLRRASTLSSTNFCQKRGKKNSWSKACDSNSKTPLYIHKHTCDLNIKVS